MMSRSSVRRFVVDFFDRRFLRQRKTSSPRSDFSDGDLDIYSYVVREREERGAGAYARTLTLHKPAGREVQETQMLMVYKYLIGSQHWMDYTHLEFVAKSSIGTRLSYVHFPGTHCCTVCAVEIQCIAAVGCMY